MITKLQFKRMKVGNIFYEQNGLTVTKHRVKKLIKEETSRQTKLLGLVTQKQSFLPSCDLRHCYLPADKDRALTDYFEQELSQLERTCQSLDRQFKIEKERQADLLETLKHQLDDTRETYLKYRAAKCRAIQD